MTRSINDIGQVMGMKTIAEFVESPVIEERLLAIGVDYAQGYHVSKPAPIDSLIDPIPDRIEQITNKEDAFTSVAVALEQKKK